MNQEQLMVASRDVSGVVTNAIYKGETDPAKLKALAESAADAIAAGLAKLPAPTPCPGAMTWSEWCQKTGQSSAVESRSESAAAGS